MTPEEKAKEIVEKFEALLFNEFTTDESWVKCVECALIAVDLILNDCGAKDWSGDEACEGRNYWQEVKQEINKL